MLWKTGYKLESLLLVAWIFVAMLTGPSYVFSQQPGVHNDNSLPLDTVLKVINEIEVSKPDSAVMLAEKAIGVYTASGDTRSRLVLINILGDIEFRKGAHEKALGYFLQAQRLSADILDTTNLVHSSMGIGNIYFRQDKFTEAENYFIEALEMAKAISNHKVVAGAMINLGMIYIKTGKPEESEKMLMNAALLSRQEGDEVNESKALNNLAFNLHRQQKYTESNTNLQQVIVLKKKMNDLFGLSVALNVMAANYNGLGKYGLAETTALEAVHYAEEIGSVILQMDAWQTLSEIYESSGDLLNALKAFKKFTACKDSVTNTDTEYMIAEMQTGFDLERKQKELEIANKENKLQETEIDHHKRRNIFLLGSMGLLLLAIILVIIILVQRTLAAKTIREQNTRLEEANALKNKLFGIIGHDLRSPVSRIITLIRKNSSAPQDTSSWTEILPPAEHLLGTMDELLYWSKLQMENFTPVKVPTHIHELTEDIVQLLTGENNTHAGVILHIPADLVFKTDPDYFSVITRNLLSNALKAGHHQPVDIYAYIHDGRLYIEVVNLGPPVPANVIDKLSGKNIGVKMNEGLGAMLIHDFTKKLGGHVEVMYADGKNTIRIVLT